MSPPLDVLLLREIGHPGPGSMSRFGEAIERGLAAASGVHLNPAPVQLRPLGWEGEQPYFTRYARFTAAALVRCRARGIVHVTDHSHAHLGALVGLRRTVVTCHDLLLLQAAAGRAGFSAPARTTARFRFTTSFLRRVARVVCDSQATAIEVVRLQRVDPARIDVVHPGVGTAFVPLDASDRQAVRHELGLDGPVVLQMSSGQPYKNTAGVLRTVAALRSGGLPVTLLRAGAPLDPVARAMARSLGIEGAIVDVGRVSDQRLAALYRVADVLLFPSHAEGFGWPPLEAMACGTPVVASDIPAIREVCGGAALTAPPDDVRGLAAAVRSVLDEPARAGGMRAAGLERAAAFSWERTVAGYLRAYHSAAA